MGMNVNVHVISTAGMYRYAHPYRTHRWQPQQDADLQRLKSYVIQGCPHKIRQSGIKYTKVLAHQAQAGSDSWKSHKRQKNNYNFTL